MDVSELERLIPKSELYCIKRSRELKQVLADMAEKIDRVPALYETDGDKNAVCKLHYFDTCGAADWYVFEVDAETLEAFGFAALDGDITDWNAEFGYIDLKGLIASERINLDLHFEGITKGDIYKARNAVAA